MKAGATSVVGSNVGSNVGSTARSNVGSTARSNVGSNEGNENTNQEDNLVILQDKINHSLEKATSGLSKTQLHCLSDKLCLNLYKIKQRCIDPTLGQDAINRLAMNDLAKDRRPEVNKSDGGNE